VFGKLRWEERGVWFAQVRDSSGEWLDVVVEPGDGDRTAVVEPAAALYKKVIRSERRILRDAVRLELLELYNDVWVQDETALTAGQLIEQLEFQFLAITPDSDPPVVLGYDAGDLFGGHTVDVEVDDKLKVVGTNLVG